MRCKSIMASNEKGAGADISCWEWVGGGAIKNVPKIALGNFWSPIRDFWILLNIGKIKCVCCLLFSSFLFFFFLFPFLSFHFCTPFLLLMVGNLGGGRLHWATLPPPPVKIGGIYPRLSRGHWFYWVKFLFSPNLRISQPISQLIA